MSTLESVLIVDDTAQVVDLMARHLERHGYGIRTASRGSAALECLREGFQGVVILDLNLPDYQALELFAEIRRINELLPVIIVTGHGTIDMAIEAIRLGAFDFLPKTDTFLERLLIATTNAMSQLSLKRKVKTLQSELGARYNFDQIVTVADAMKPVFELMQHAVQSRVTVLILGESGTGKELIARALHYMGSRASGPFVAVNCAGIPETLLESELFGYEKGAFTGATSRKRGKFELANNGTLFLDEVGEMPLLLQAKLLRVLQERTIERLGGTDPVPLDVRIVCATNRDLVTEVRASRFREDLYYRLAVFPIRVPPLRERRGDAAVLAQYFLERSAREEGKTLPGFDSRALAALQGYAFPGNVRELQNAVAHAVVLATSGALVGLAQLPAELAASVEATLEPARPAAGPLPGAAPAGPLSLERALELSVRTPDTIPSMETVERLTIERAVALCDGNLVSAANRLGISRATIYRRVNSFSTRRDE